MTLLSRQKLSFFFQPLLSVLLPIPYTPPRAEIPLYRRLVSASWSGQALSLFPWSDHVQRTPPIPPPLSCPCFFLLQQMLGKACPFSGYLSFRSSCLYSDSCFQPGLFFPFFFFCLSGAGSSAGQGWGPRLPACFQHRPDSVPPHLFSHFFFIFFSSLQIETAPFPCSTSTALRSSPPPRAFLFFFLPTGTNYMPDAYQFHISLLALFLLPREVSPLFFFPRIVEPGAMLFRLDFRRSYRRFPRQPTGPPTRPDRCCG